MAPLATLQAACRTYVDGEIEVPALRGIDLQIEADVFTVVVGPSGCGKTTLLNVLGCLDRLSSGSLQLAGHDVAQLDDRALTRLRAEQLGFIFQNFSLIPVLSARENVEYGLIGSRIAAAEKRARVDEVLQAVGLAQHARHRPGQLSGGQRQRVAIARALVKRPALVLADEPTANLDSETGAAIIALMRQMQRSWGTTFVFSTHDPALMEHADRTLRMSDGRIVGDEPARWRAAA